MRRTKTKALLSKAALPTNARREKRERERARDEAIFSESSSPSSESKCFEFYARKETPPRNERYEIKRTLLPPDFCPPDTSLSFFSVSSGMNRFGVSVFRLLLRSVIVHTRALFCNEHLSLLSKNTPKKTRNKREFCEHSRAHIFRVSIETRLKIRTRVCVCAHVPRVHFQL